MSTIACLLAFRDEEPFLPAFLAAVLPAVDIVVALDDRSTDGGPDLLERAGANVMSAPDVTTFGERRQLLLERGRSLGATHFLCLDADECLTRPLSTRGRDVFAALHPGEALAVPFRTLWRGTGQYRIGREYQLPLACAFGDDPSVDYDVVNLHEPRIPAAITNRRRLPPSVGSIAHLQFVPWNRAQAKQAWYRCRELLDGKDAGQVNARYLVTLETPFVRTRPMGDGELSHLPPLDALAELPLSWHVAEVLHWFDEHGPERFERLHIWHVPALRDAFVARVGRPPKSDTLARTIPYRLAATARELSAAAARKARARLGRAALRPARS